MIIHRSHPESRFTIIPDETLRDPRLSYVARGVLAEILSRPDEWQTNAVAIAGRARRERAKAGEGRRAILAAFAELAAARYLFRIRRRSPGGHMVTELHIFDVAQECQPDGQPVYFALAAQLTGIPPSGMSVPPAQTPIPAGRTDIPLTGAPVTGTPVTGTPVGGTSIRRPTTDTLTEIFKGDRDKSNPGVLQSPVPVEGTRPARYQDRSQRENAERNRQLAALEAWMAQASEPAAAVNGATPAGHCAHCGKPMPDGKRPGAAYCSRRCKNTASKRRTRKEAAGG